MKKIINWKTFFSLQAGCVVTSLFVVLYQASLVPALADMGIALYLGSLLQGTVIFSVVTFLGLLLARKVGFSLPILEGENRRKGLNAILKPSILWGLFGGTIITLLVVLFGKVSLELMAAELAVPVWVRFLAVFYGGIAEEVLMRLFVMSFIAWLLIKIKLPKNASIWIAIILSAILFGLGHLPATGELTDITAIIIARAIMLNGVVGIVFGLLYWKKGLESAMIAHFSTGIVLRFITPLVANFFISS